MKLNIIRNIFLIGYKITGRSYGAQKNIFNVLLYKQAVPNGTRTA